MKIQKRSSNGRGEYEIAGSIDGIGTSAILALPLVIDAGNTFGQLPTGIRLLTQGGKPRLRLIEKSGIHIQRQLEALLLMPKSRREESQLEGGQPVLIAGRYILSEVEVVELEVFENRAVLKLGGIECKNDSGVQQVDFSKRMAALDRLYLNADKLPEHVSAALLKHRDYIVRTGAVDKGAERLVLELIQATEEAVRDSGEVLISGEDPVPLLLDLLSTLPTVDIPFIDEIDPRDIEIRRRIADRWRLQKDRGPSSVKFRKAVRDAYDSTCLFCGLKLVASEAVRIPGVDAAHIVPWSEYDADFVHNGLCLCKLHHWAFDQYLLALKFEEVSGYEIVVTELAKQAYGPESSVLNHFNALAGPIQDARLPAKLADRPKPELLTRLYEDVGVEL
ncbi:HNH endonuclease [Pseudomonas aeruginosa]|uniref:HNH endonuclease n=1 Tax=Pseudomonas aeruginosa TaxID=287 RepID=UPI001374DAB0|nr:HNH endonuclease [Pseudomonas aeruginosa]MBG4519896.1 HNH endonuclease [Pseudomonas aeruginosa]MBG5829077.1 HNH endonuclease [Pseudomonas aeruginosa]MCU9072598.1 HNH endonuclease [Pseudomonas aeruginosa]MCU9146543.1 HNH endonuclease [Pseudomonas aeruginosa]MCU9242328.1 HNH endonuclease [Pseudomonas aeruginosa]|tara:strand:- start:525 stop:1700 length:1176 start_codon:yes stop_codon:yes gene_type:complete